MSCNLEFWITTSISKAHFLLLIEQAIGKAERERERGTGEEHIVNSNKSIEIWCSIEGKVVTDDNLDTSFQSNKETSLCQAFF